MILLLIAVILLAALFQSSVRRRGLKGLEVELSFPQALVEQETPFVLTLELVNRRRVFFRS